MLSAQSIYSDLWIALSLNSEWRSLIALLVNDEYCSLRTEWWLNGESVRTYSNKILLSVVWGNPKSMTSSISSYIVTKLSRILSSSSDLKYSVNTCKQIVNTRLLLNVHTYRIYYSEEICYGSFFRVLMFTQSTRLCCARFYWRRCHVDRYKTHLPRLICTERSIQEQHWYSSLLLQPLSKIC